MNEKILYLHDLDSKPDKNKIGYLTECGYSVTAPKFDYRAGNNQRVLYDSLCLVVENSDPDIIIGDGLGGFIAIAIGNKFGLPVLAAHPENHPDKINVIIPLNDNGEFDSMKLIMWPENSLYNMALNYNTSFVYYDHDPIHFDFWKKIINDNIKELIESNAHIWANSLV